MAGIRSISARIGFKMDTGEMKGDKHLYRSVSIGRIDGEASAGALGEVAGSLKGLLRFPAVIVTLSRTDEIEV
ncbi:MAG: hypothetical protein LBS45_07715 [Synergistaceae bacterium]|jgi:hypothetical protein|nr:hypothetical protein [Synergistaceae bacterium]